MQRLETLDSDFKKHHLALVDLLDAGDEEVLQKEQDVLDEHDDVIALLATRVQRLITLATALLSPKGSSPREIASRRLRRLKRDLSSISCPTESVCDHPPDVCRLRHTEEQLSDLKSELRDISRGIIDLDLDDEDELTVLESSLKKEIFDKSLQVKGLLSSATSVLQPQNCSRWTLRRNYSAPYSALVW